MLMRPVLRSSRFLFLILLLAQPISSECSPLTCTYETYRWNVHLKRAVAFSHVSHPYSKLSKEEVDPVTGCTVCMEDQVELKVAALPPFRACRRLAPELKSALEQLARDGVPLYRVVGYRPGKTRGDIDADGNRTSFSNHAYGTALDINPEQNGLYTDCVRFGPQCKLVMGGEWRPGEQPASLLPGGKVVSAMRSIGFRWGGEIKGRQKDFMHFSISGY